MTRLQHSLAARKLHRQPDLRSPIGKAIMRQTIQKEVQTLLTDAGVHTLIGDDKPLMLHKLGWLFWCTIGGAVRCGIGTEPPDINILRSACNLLGDPQESTDPSGSSIDRATLMSAVTACQRLHRHIPEFDVMRAAAELVGLLANGGSMGTAYIERLVHGQRETQA